MSKKIIAKATACGFCCSSDVRESEQAVNGKHANLNVKLGVLIIA